MYFFKRLNILKKYVALASVFLFTFSCNQYPNVSNNTFTSNVKYSGMIPIKGTVEFSANSTFTTQATLADVGLKATVSLLYPSDYNDPALKNTTIATGLTSDSGIFVINTASGFQPLPGSTFVLEASRRIGASGNTKMTVRTNLQWTGSEWKSITKPDIKINSKTTALSIISDYNLNNFRASDTIDKLLIQNGQTQVTDITTTGGFTVNASTITGVESKVNEALTDNTDPVFEILLDNGEYKLRKTLAPPTQTSGCTTIANGDVKTAALGQSVKFFCFTGTAGDYVTIAQTRTGSSGDAFLRLYAPGIIEDRNAPTHENDDYGGGINGNSKINKWKLPATGVWKIETATFGDLPSNAGDFTISFNSEPAPPVCEIISDKERKTGIVLDLDPATGKIKRKSFCFDGTAGDKVKIRQIKTADATNAVANAYLYLYKPNGSLFLENDNEEPLPPSPNRYNSLIDLNSTNGLTLTESGMWKIQAATLGDSPKRAGTFDLEFSYKAVQKPPVNRAPELPVVIRWPRSDTVEACDVYNMSTCRPSVFSIKISDKDIIADKVRLNINWGDGSPVYSSDYFQKSATIDVTHFYFSTNHMNVWMVAEDEAGNTSPALFRGISVGEPGIRVSAPEEAQIWTYPTAWNPLATPAGIFTNDPVTISATFSSVDDVFHSPLSFRVKIDWGDGDVPYFHDTLINGYGTINASHVYTSPGSYEVIIRYYYYNDTVGTDSEESLTTHTRVFNVTSGP